MVQNMPILVNFDFYHKNAEWTYPGIKYWVFGNPEKSLLFFVSFLEVYLIAGWDFLQIYVMNNVIAEVLKIIFE